MAKVLIFTVLLISCNSVRNQEYGYAQNLYPHINTEIIDLPEDGDMSPFFRNLVPYEHNFYKVSPQNPQFPNQLNSIDVENNTRHQNQDIPVNNQNPQYHTNSITPSNPQLSVDRKVAKDSVQHLIQTNDNADNVIDDPLLQQFPPANYPLPYYHQTATNPSLFANRSYQYPQQSPDYQNTQFANFPYQYPQQPSKYQYIPSVNPSYEYDPNISPYQMPQVHNNSDASNSSQNLIEPNVSDDRIQYSIQNFAGNNLQDPELQQYPSPNYPAFYHQTANTPSSFLNPSYQHSQEPANYQHASSVNPSHEYSQQSYSYQYRPFFPPNYIQHRYPHLYRVFPGGFFILPLSTYLPNTIDATENTVTQVTPIGTTSFPENQKVEIPLPFVRDPPNQHNYSHSGQHKTYTSKVDIKPVSTVLTRYTGRDGKTHVKVITSDGSGKKNEAVSEHKGGINLKITNGVLEEPKNLSRKNNTLEDKEHPGIDPNSILQQKEIEVDQDSKNQKVNSNDSLLQKVEVEENTKEPEDTDGPLGILSWLD